MNTIEQKIFKAKEVQELTNITFRQLDTLVTSGAITNKSLGSGYKRQYDINNIFEIYVVRECYSLGLKLEVARAFIDHINEYAIIDNKTTLRFGALTITLDFTEIHEILKEVNG